MAQTTDPNVHQLIAIYAQSHQNATNEIIHFVCVPAIMLAVLGLIGSASPAAAVGVSLLALVYYVRLSPPFAVGMALMGVVMLALLAALPQASLLPASGAVFVVAWIVQFIGHSIEGKKPSFFDDLRFLLIGPLFVLGFVYRRLGIRY